MNADESEARLRAAGGEHLRAWVRADFGLDLSAIGPVGHGADEQAELWRGVCADGTPYAVKLSGGGTPAGLVVSAHLAATACRVSCDRHRPGPGGSGANRRDAGCPWSRGCQVTARSRAG